MRLHFTCSYFFALQNVCWPLSLTSPILWYQKVKLKQQHMAELSPERLPQEPPFTLGDTLDLRWSCRHQEVDYIIYLQFCRKSTSASSWIIALWRFFSISGPVQQFKFKCRTNFNGTSFLLQLSKEDLVAKHLFTQKRTRVFNFPNASNIGDSVEVMIGKAQRILEVSLNLKIKSYSRGPVHIDGWRYCNYQLQTTSTNQLRSRSTSRTYSINVAYAEDWLCACYTWKQMSALGTISGREFSSSKDILGKMEERVPDHPSKQAETKCQKAKPLK